MAKLTVFYSIHNGGDGSAYPRFLESKELADFDQDHQSEGWGESCTGSISFESDTAINCTTDIYSKEKYYAEHIFNGGDEEEFLAKFFPDGLPKFTVETAPIPKEKKYLKNNVFCNGKKIAEIFRRIDESGDYLEALLNKLLISTRNNETIY